MSNFSSFKAAFFVVLSDQASSKGGRLGLTSGCVLGGVEDEKMMSLGFFVVCDDDYNNGRVYKLLSKVM